MLEIKNLSLRLRENDRLLLDNFTFTLNPGDKAVLIGEEGNGKSTLLQLLYQPQLVADYCQYSGVIVRKGRLAYLPQALPPALGQQSVAQYLDYADAYLYEEILRRLALPPEFCRSPQPLATLSGGEKVKLQLARLLQSEPELLLLDEPTNDLDLATLAWLEDFLVQTRLPLLYVSHDETLIENTANIIIHLEQLGGKVKPRTTIARSDYRSYAAARSAALAKQTQVAKKQRSDYQAQMERWQQIYNRVDHEQREISRGDPSGGRLLKKKMKAVKSQEKRLQRESEEFLDIPQTEEAILARFSPDITLPRGKTVLDFHLPQLQAADRLLAGPIDLEVYGPEHIGITGANGVGKSTLLAGIWQELRQRRDLSAAYMPQDYRERLDDRQTPVDYLAGRYTKDELTRARTYLGSMRFTRDEMTGPIARLSGGQRAKLLFLDMVLQKATVLLLDEPTRNFSPLSAPVIRQTLQEYGGAIISVSHDRKYLAQVCEKVYELTSAGLRRS